MPRLVTAADGRGMRSVRGGMDWFYKAPDDESGLFIDYDSRAMTTTNRVTVGGRSFRYLESGAGWPVVLIHAFPLNAEMWRPQLRLVPHGFRFIAPDLRSFGESDVEAAPLPTMDDYAADIGGLLDALEIERAVIGGLSMGGYVTFALFRAAPERFSGMLLADTRSQADTPAGRESRRTMSQLVLTEGTSAVADQMIPKLLGETTRREYPDIATLVRQVIEANHPAAIEGALNALMTRPDSTPDLGRIDCPTLIVVGSEDTLTPPADSQALHEAISRSHLVVVPAAGHLSSLEDAEGFSTALEDFLRSSI
jgi:3-oxoadipate enol-lactonase